MNIHTHTQILGLEDNKDGYLNKGVVISVGFYALYLFEVTLHSCNAHHHHGHHLPVSHMHWRMQDFLKGGSVTILRAENLKPCPFLIKTTPIFDHFGEKLLALPVNLSIFDRDFC